MLDIVSEFYPGITEYKSLLEETCKDIPKAKIAFNHYYDERLKMNADTSPEGAKKMTDARGCMAAIVAECQVKRQMGFIQFRR
ncbi:hypothetical protein NPIL_175501 [Nephila pilipes]|nr:hypothetical protein NPIL_175501 [Nephila pilipes]